MSRQCHINRFSWGPYRSGSSRLTTAGINVQRVCIRASHKFADIIAVVVRTSPEHVFSEINGIGIKAQRRFECSITASVVNINVITVTFECKFVISIRIFSIRPRDVYFNCF